MAKKLNLDADLFLNKFVELRKKNPMSYPRISEVCASLQVNQHHFRKCFESTAKFYELADARVKKALTKSELGLLTEKGRAFDPNITADQCIADLRRVQELFPLSHITRTKYRNEGQFSDQVWSRFFGTMEEFRRQAGLQLTRHQHGLEKHVAKHVAHDHYKEYFVTEVLPYHNKYQVKQLPGKIKTMLVGSDMHDIEIDEFCLEVFIDTAKKMQPDIICLNGDIYDLYEFSNFSQDPRHIKMVERFAFVRDRIFKPLRDACPNAQIDFFMGNHEYRLLRMLADKTPNLRVLLSDVLGLTFSQIFGLDEFKINWVSKLDLGAFNKSESKKQLQANYKIYFDCYAVTHEPMTNMGISGTNGHHHQAKLTSMKTPLGGEMTWVQTPGMHVSDAEYLHGLGNWNTGFLKVHINTEKKEVVQNIIQTHEWAVVHGIYYERKEKI